MPTPSRLVAPLLVALAACTYPLLRQHWLDAAVSAVPAPADDRLRVVCWNLRNFPGDHDLARLKQQLEALRPQVLAAQEVLDPQALARLLPSFRWQVSRSGGRHGQHVAIGWDPQRVQRLAPLDHDELGMEGHVRPALSAYLRGRAGGPDFHLVVVHLKATRSGLPVRRQQWPRLVSAIADRKAAGPDDEDVLVVGDFNVAGGVDVSPEREHAELAAALAAADLSPWELVGDCTAYWEGSRRDAWWEPSRLDLVWTAGFAELAPETRRAWPGAHCERHACDPVHATEHHPDPDLQGISDHCPIVIDLPFGEASRAPS
ncbi:MAG: endonuclease/exonuclease/phosphatase family protein [Nannocystaceae bacterium]